MKPFQAQQADYSCNTERDEDCMNRENIIAHRGFWLDPSEKNAISAFERALDGGFGIETDFRDLDGELVIAHDIPRQGQVMSAADFFATCAARSDWRGVLALNIKADGLQRLMHAALQQAGLDHPRNFAFDMAVPDALAYARNGLVFYTRQSEYELQPSLLDCARGVWVDNFLGDFDQIEHSITWLTKGYKVAFVSPELHGRAHQRTWNKIGEAGLHRNNDFAICTDFPADALTFFQGLK